MENTPTDHDSHVVAQLTEIQLSLVLYVRSLMPGDGMAKDVAQQTNVKIWEKRSDYELGTNFRAWAFSIARFEVLSYRKRKARDNRLVFSADLQDSITDDLLSAESDLGPTHEALQRCLAKLQQQEKQLLLHRYASRDTLAEYANQVGRSVGGLKVTLHRLRNKLLDCIHRQLGAT